MSDVRIELGSATLLDRIKTALLWLLPQHLISRLIFWLTRQQSRFTTAAILRFIRAFNVDMRDAVEPDPGRYKTFNEFFTRALKDSARPIASEAQSLACPADGRISAMGNINEARAFQAKGHDYSLRQLLGDDVESSERLAQGSFMTIYLSPSDYHRLHMPLSGKLLSQVHVPGRLHSVSPFTVRALPGLFTSNERVVANFETEQGLMSLVLVGAINVAAIETVWHGLITPPKGKTVSRLDYPADKAAELAKGEEMGRFNMGSTIIVLMESRINWRQDMQADQAVRMGQFLGKLPNT